MQQQAKPRQYNNIKPKKWWQKLMKRKIDYTQLLDRSIYSNVPDEEICNNKIETSKYNYFTFLPLNVIEQFSKLSNIYFLLIGILQTIPVISLSGGKPTIFMPLFFVVLVSMIKDFIENLKRRKSDEKENESEVEFLSSVGFVVRKWEDLRVGDIIRVKKDQYFPCDVVLLDHPRDQKTAFIQTKNLDGETNLKLKKTCQNLDFVRELSELDLSSLQIQFAFEKPNPFLSTFNGNVKIRNFMVENSNLVLRGCSLKINEWAVGICIYTGHETKILLNSGVKKIKVSSLERNLGKYFRLIFLFQLSVTLLSSIIFGILYSVNEKNIGYVSLNGNIAANIFFTWGSWFISFSNFIPISLVVSVETVRYGQGMILNKDELCRSKGQPAEVQTSSINEELGQIKYIMTDKTGTLTQNLMEFKCFYVDGQKFGSTLMSEDIIREEDTYRDSHSSVRSGLQIKEKLEQIKLLSQRIPNIDFSEVEKQKIVRQILSGSNHGMKIRNSLIHLALCHNVVPQKNSYTSSSPDELALVSFAKFIGYEFIQKNDFNQLQILEKIGGKETKLKYKLLHTLEFSSQRKRMSVILSDLNSEKTRLVLLIKGADEIILSRLQKGQNERQVEENERIVKVLYDYACLGLRTLLIAEKELDQKEYLVWNEKYDEALTIIGPERYDKMDELQSEIEKQLTIVGATAIEDKLQSQVKETIQDLRKSNIKVWMLTGDKKETAISIGFACGLIDKNSQRIVLDCDAEHAKPLLLNLISMLDMIRSQKVTILSGEFIKKIDEQTKQLLQDILSQSESVICCRVSPKDKQEITKMVSKWGITLAIGDGANDVNMINGANVGVGVRGIEGSQATRAADYIITEFKLLKRLIVYHGLNYYHRNSNVMLYTLYKNMLVTLPNLLYGPLSMQSGTYIYDIWSVQFFNIFYVSFPIVYYGLFDILYSSKQLKQKPWEYVQGQNSAYFNKKVLVKQFLQVLIADAFLLYVVFFSTEQQISGRGYMIYTQWSGNLILAIVIVSCNIRVILISNQLNVMQGFLVSLGIVSYFIVTYLISIILQNDIKNLIGHQLGTGLYWVLLFLACFVIEGVQLFFMIIHNMRKVIEKAKKVKEKFEKTGSDRMKEVQLPDVSGNKELQVRNEAISERNEIGGYAFAEDDNRMALVTQMESLQHQKSLNML